MILSASFNILANGFFEPKSTRSSGDKVPPFLMQLDSSAGGREEEEIGGVKAWNQAFNHQLTIKSGSTMKIHAKLGN